MSWKKGNLALLADEIGEGYKPDGAEDIPYLGLEHLEPQTLQLLAVGSSLEVQSSKQKFKRGDILFGTMRPYFRKVARPTFDGICSTEFSVIRAKDPADGDYVFYFVAQPKFVEFSTTNSKGDRPRTKWDLFSQYPTQIPPPIPRRRIGTILYAYDNLIENNRRQIALLEETAQQLYREWFVRLRFPGHEHTHSKKGVPDGWTNTTLGDCLTLQYGKALKAEERVDGDYPVYGSSGIVGTHEKALVKGPAIIVGRKGNVGSVFWSSKDFHPIDTVYFIDAETSNLYLYYALQHMQFVSSDVAVPGLNRDYAHSRPLLLPKKNILSAFLDFVSPLQQQIEKLNGINQRLRTARDLLLPKLMSGEIAV